MMQGVDLLPVQVIIYFIEKTKWGKFETSYFEKHTNSPILSIVTYKMSKFSPTCFLEVREPGLGSVRYNFRG